MWYLRETRKDEASKWDDYEPLDFPEVEGNEKYLRAIEKIEGYWNTNVQLYAAMVMQTKTINFVAACAKTDQGRFEKMLSARFQKKQVQKGGLVYETLRQNMENLTVLKSAVKDLAESLSRDTTEMTRQIGAWRKAWKKAEVDKAPKSVDKILPFVLDISRSEWEPEKKEVAAIKLKEMLSDFYPLAKQGRKLAPADLTSFCNLITSWQDCTRILGLSMYEKEVIGAYYPDPILDLAYDMQDCVLDEVNGLFTTAVEATIQFTQTHKQLHQAMWELLRATRFDDPKDKASKDKPYNQRAPGPMPKNVQAAFKSLKGFIQRQSKEAQVIMFTTKVAGVDTPFFELYPVIIPKPPKSRFAKLAQSLMSALFKFKAKPLALDPLVGHQISKLQGLMREHARIVDNIKLTCFNLRDAFSEAQNEWLVSAGNMGGKSNLVLKLEEENTDASIVKTAKKNGKHNLQNVKKIVNLISKMEKKEKRWRVDELEKGRKNTFVTKVKADSAKAYMREERAPNAVDDIVNQVASVMLADGDGSQEDARMQLVHKLRAAVWKRDNASRQADDKVEVVEAESEDKRSTFGKMMGKERELTEEEQKTMGVAKLFAMFAPGSTTREKLEKELKKRQKKSPRIKLEMLSLFSQSGTMPKRDEEVDPLTPDVVQNLLQKRSMLSKGLSKEDKEKKKELDAILGAKFEMVVIPFAEQKELLEKVALRAFSEKQFKYSAKDVASIAAKPKVVDFMAAAIERRCNNSADDVGVDHAARRDFVRWCVAEAETLQSFRGNVEKKSSNYLDVQKETDSKLLSFLHAAESAVLKKIKGHDKLAKGGLLDTVAKEIAVEMTEDDQRDAKEKEITKGKDEAYQMKNKLCRGLKWTCVGSTHPAQMSEAERSQHGFAGLDETELNSLMLMCGPSTDAEKSLDEVIKETGGSLSAEQLKECGYIEEQLKKGNFIQTEGGYFRPTDELYTPLENAINKVTKSMKTQQEQETLGAQKAAAFAKQAVVHSPTAAWDALQVSFGMGGVDEFPEVMPTGMPLIDDRALNGFTSFAKIVSMVNSWRAKRLAFIKAASALAGKTSELNMRGAVFEVVKGINSEIDKEKAAFASRFRPPDGNPLALEVHFVYDEASAGGDSHYDMTIAPDWEMIPGLKKMLGSSSPSQPPPEKEAPAALTVALKALGEYLGTFNVFEMVEADHKKMIEEDIMQGNDGSAVERPVKKTKLESYCQVDDQIGKACKQMESTLLAMEKEAEMLTWDAAVDPSQQNPLDSLPDDCLAFLANKIDQGKSLSTLEANLFKRFTGVDVPESLDPQALLGSTAEVDFYSSLAYETMLEQLRSLPMESIDALAATSKKAEEAAKAIASSEEAESDLREKMTNASKKGDLEGMEQAKRVFKDLQDLKTWMKKNSPISMKEATNIAKGVAVGALKQGISEVGVNLFAGSNPVTGVLLGIKKAYQLGKAAYKVANRRFKAKKAKALAALGKAKKKLQKTIVATAAYANYKEMKAFLKASSSFPKQIKSDFQTFVGVVQEDRRMKDLQQKMLLTSIGDSKAKMLKDSRDARMEQRAKAEEAAKLAAEAEATASAEEKEEAKTKTQEAEEAIPGWDADDYKVHLRVTMDSDLKILIETMLNDIGDDAIARA